MPPTLVARVVAARPTRKDDEVPIWRSVDVFPNRGFADKPWLPHPDDDAFVRSARRVWFAYSDALPALKLPMPTSHLRIFCPPRPPDHAHPGTAVTVRLDGLEREEFQGAGLQLPPGIAELSEDSRALLALDVIHFAAGRLAALTGWDGAHLDDLRQRVLDQGLEVQWASAWKSSPDRKHKARMIYRVDERGMGCMRVEVTAGDVVRSTAETFCPVGYKHVAKGIRWAGSDALTFEEFDGRYNPTPTRVEVGDLEPMRHRKVAVDLTAERPAVVAKRHPTEPLNRIVRRGGGDTGGVPAGWLDLLHRTYDHLTSDEWQSWWETAELGTLELEYEIGPHIEARDFLVRKGSNKVTARPKLPSYTIAGDADHAALVHELVAELMERVRKRAGLGPHPEIPRLSVDEAFAESPEEYERRVSRFREFFANHRYR